MCGIVGFVGEEKAAPILLQGLHRLEYRGYDSAGIAVSDNGVTVIKEKGRIDNLESEVTKENPEGTIGIGHTRWATHGVPDKTNAHPHKSMNGIVTLVHNGIIENYIELKNDLIAKGYKFISQTDTEVIAQLFDSLNEFFLRNAGQIAGLLKNDIIPFVRNYLAYYRFSDFGILICILRKPISTVGNRFHLRIGL